MFVVINNTDQGAYIWDGIIGEARKSGHIPPSFAMNILSKTNNRANILKLVRAIRKKCTTKEQLEPYKEFILSCVDGRETSDEVMSVLRDMVQFFDDEFKDEFEKVNKHQKFYGEFDCTNTRVVKSKRELMGLKGADFKIYVDIPYLDFFNDDLSGFEHLRFKKGSKITFQGETILPVGLDVSECAEVVLDRQDLSNVKELKFAEGAKISLRKVMGLPEDLDVSMCAEVNLSANDLRGLKELKFRDGAKVILCNRDLLLEGVSGDYSSQKGVCLPEDLDVSMCSEVDLSTNDLSNIKELKFRDGAKVTLIGVENLPHDLDVSMCDYVSLRGCCLSELKDIKFKEGADVDLSRIKKFPEYIDVSTCDYVTFAESDLSGVKELKFREGSIVDLSYAENLPSKIDLSMCKEVSLFLCDLTGVEEIKFKDEKQKDLFMGSLLKDFSGKIVYKYDESKAPLGVKIYKDLMKVMS